MKDQAIGIESSGTESPQSCVVELASAPTAVLETLGGKGARLAELVQSGFRVPPGFVITTHGFATFMAEEGLRARIAKQEGAVAACKQIRETIQGAAIPGALEQEIRQAYRAVGEPKVAVRSSAIGEDSAERSFAGQHDTILNVQGEDAVIEAVKQCWGSLWSDRAWTYREAKNEKRTLEIAVVVQQMVPAEAAGVMFTTSPVGDADDQLIIEACWGLGEALVSGRVATDSYIIDRESLAIVDRQIRYKRFMCDPEGSNDSDLVEVAADRREEPTLSNDQLRTLAEQGLKLKDHYGSEQDVEWGVYQGDIHILQTRPITTTPRETQRLVDPHVVEAEEKIRNGTLWSRMDIGEIFTGIMTPLGLSFGKYYQYNTHGDCIKSLGLLDVCSPDYYMGYAQGHVYLNVSYSSYFLSQTPPNRDQDPFTERFSSEEVDLADYSNPWGEFPEGPELKKCYRYWTKEFIKELIIMKRRARKLVDSRFREYDRFLKVDLTKMSREELAEEFTYDLEYFRQMNAGYMPYYINAFAFYGILEELCGSWLGEEGKKLQNRFKTDMSNLRTVESARELHKLVEASRDYPGVEKIIRSTPPTEAAGALRADPNGARFWNDAIEPFMRKEGVRGRQEMELTNPRWVDDPAYVIQMMCNYYEHDISIDDILGKNQKARCDESDEILRRLPLLRRMALRFVIRLYSLCSELREATRMSMCTSSWIVRRLVYETGRRLVEAGILKSLDEVTYLDFFDILDWVYGRRSMADAFQRDKIDAARREHGHNLRIPEPPLTFIGRFDPSERVLFTEDGSTVRGLGTSPGRVVGRARVVRDLVQQSAEFQPGEILVTTFTDASWTPLFLIAAGVVTDIGSMLSHSSIVAREFNIPSVVNTKIATKAIKTGDMLIVDGDEGTVDVQQG